MELVFSKVHLVSQDPKVLIAIKRKGDWMMLPFIQDIVDAFYFLRVYRL